MNFEQIEGIMRKMDYPAMGVGILAIISNFVISYDSAIGKIINISLCLIATVLAVCYIAYALYLYFGRRVDFDRHLIHGHFARKVCCVVLLIPSLLTTISLLFTFSPKELSYEEVLYQCGDKELPCEIKSSQQSPNIFWSVYYHFVDPGNQHMTTTKAGRVWAAVIAILGVFLLNGLLVSSIVGWIDLRKEKWLSGEVRYKPRDLGENRFAVVIGANEIAASVIKNLFTPKKAGEINYKCEGDNQYVVLQTSRKVEEVRTELASHLNSDLLKRVVIYKALRDSAEEIDKLYLKDSTELYVLGESTLIDGGETYHDAMNMRCVNLIAKDLEKTRNSREESKEITDISVRKVCKVMFEYQTTSSIFQFSDISEDIKNNIVFIPFNRYESWARAVIADSNAVEDCNVENGETIKYTPFDGENGIKDDDPTHVHFVVVGMSKMGVAMGVQAMLQAHYMNYAVAEMVKSEQQCEHLKNERRTRITFIDTNADKEMAFFKGRYDNLFSMTRYRYLDATTCNEVDLMPTSVAGWIDPMETSAGKWEHLSDGGENFIDIEIEFIKGEIESDGVRKYLRNISNMSNGWVKTSNLTVAVCLSRTHQAIAASLYMPISVYEKAQEVWVYQRESADVVLNLIRTSQNDKRYKKLKPFGMLYSEYMNDRSQYLKALLVNGAYDLDGKINGKTVKAADFRDMSNKDTYRDLNETWKDLSIDKKFSNRYFVDSIPLKTRYIKAVGLSEKNLEDNNNPHTKALAISEHNRWNVQQLLLGYSPCNKEQDAIFEKLNAACIADKPNYKAWQERVGWGAMSPKERMDAKKENAEYKTLAKGKFDAEKTAYKEGADRIHPNICEYSHLDKVDSDAKGYDFYLNSILPTIKVLIDDKVASAPVNDNK